MKQFSYREIASLNLLDLKDLNKLGEEGWELVSIIKYADGTTNYRYFFKKEI